MATTTITTSETPVSAAVTSAPAQGQQVTTTTVVLKGDGPNPYNPEEKVIDQAINQIFR